MRAPAFWSNPPGRPGLLAHLLAPLAWLWAAATRRRMARPGLRLGVPVICVDNLTAGGAGKTPTVIALVERLKGRGVAVQVVSRGHGGSLAGPVRVEERRHKAAEVGDEPLLLAAFAPVWVARDRAAAGRAAAADGAQVVVMDDGMQNQERPGAPRASSRARRTRSCSSIRPPRPRRTAPMPPAFSSADSATPT
jgi:tetraacyldisaccharide 4'-kinase